MKNVVYIFTQPLHDRQDMTQDQSLSRVQLVWIGSFGSGLPNQKPSPLYYLPMAGRRAGGFMPSRRGLVQSETVLIRT